MGESFKITSVAMADLETEKVMHTVGYIKLGLGAIMGLAFGLLGFTGVYAMITFALVATAASFYYVTKILDLDDEDLGRWDLLKEGWQGFFIFLLCWIFAYNL